MKRSRIPPISAKRRQRSGKPGHLGIIRLYGADMQALRLEAFERSGGRCEMQWNDRRCDYPISFENFELAHVVSRGAGGSDTLDNVLCSCKWRADGHPGCHVLSHNTGGTPCPRP